MDVFDPSHSMEICVKECPNTVLATPYDVKKFAEDTGSYLCRYDITLDQYSDWSLYTTDGSGPCPVLPILIE